MVEGTPPGDALPPPPQRATPARRGARCGAGAGSPRPHPPHPGHTGGGTPAARSRGRAAGGGTAPDNRRPSQRWQASPPGDSPPPPPRHAAPTGHAGQGNSVGPPHPHSRAHSTWVADPNSPPSGRAVGEGQRLTLDAPHNGGRHPPGDALPPPPQRATPARKGARCGAGAGSPRPHRPHPGHTGRGTLAARSRGQAARGGTAPHTRRPSQQWQATPPGDGPPPPPRHAVPTGHASQGDGVGPPRPHTRAHSTWVADPNSPPNGRAVGGGTAPDLRRPSQGWKAPPPGNALPPPPQRATSARKGAHCAAGAGSPRPHRPHPGHVGHGTLAARSRGQAAGGGTAPDTRCPSQRWQGTPPGDGPLPPPRHAAPTGHAGQGGSVGLPHPHTRAQSTWVADPDSPPQWVGSRGRDSAWPQTPLTMMEGTCKCG